ncbi:Fe-S cluster assembly iron-binding protein IscA [Alteribacillus persepolensis]|uniref:Fe-S cluster assembly iron-binding protein IscA n=1 Tax=Alteribacillus persepolensis TaxID=568899 RepID=A0A1G8GWZ6_9BACI|nr:iron-sulfur cluster biosynthesis family protein [Alteribacillus persepolensis]SDH98811.1 Fe-S cluster assembly iron-binding protein IscA [Alteribacillus persepolensis]
MAITFSETAREKLRDLTLAEGHVLRIDADMAGGCGISMSCTLKQDEPRRMDKVLECDGISIHIDSFTERYLDSDTHIDYTEEGLIIEGQDFSSSCSFDM